MKIEMHIEGPNVSAWFVDAVVGYTAARAADEAAWQEKHGNNAAGARTPVEATPTAEAEKPKATRGRKAKEESAPEQAQITTSSEDRKPEDPIEDAEIVDDKPKTRDDMKAAMRSYQDKFGMEKTMEDMPGLLGAAKQSLVAEDSAVFAAVIDRINAALEADPNG